MNSYFNYALNTNKTYFIHFVEFVSQAFSRSPTQRGVTSLMTSRKKCPRVPNWHPADSDP